MNKGVFAPKTKVATDIKRPFGKAGKGLAALSPTTKLTLMFAVPIVMLLGIALLPLLGGSAEKGPAMPEGVNAPAATNQPTFNPGSAPTRNLAASTTAANPFAVHASNAATGNQPKNSPATSGPTTPPGDYLDYTIKAGDFIATIAQKHGVKVSDIYAANNLNEQSARSLQIGKVIKIPKKAALAAATTNANPSANTATSSPTIPTNAGIKFDTTGLFARPESQAQATTTSVPTRIITNKLVCQRQRHVLADGDNPYTLASQYYSDFSQHQLIRNANPTVDWRTPVAGTVIIIPEYSAEVEEVLDTPATGLAFGAETVQVTDKPMERYVVQPGDTLSKVAKKLYGNPNYWTILAKANNLREPYSLTIGQVLQVPQAR